MNVVSQEMKQVVHLGFDCVAECLVNEQFAGGELLRLVLPDVLFTNYTSGYVLNLKKS